VTVRILILVSAGTGRRKKHSVTLSAEAYKVVEGEMGTRSSRGRMESFWGMS